MANQSFSQMRLRNAESILETVRLHSEISRADLARETELSPATVSSIVDDLIKTGFLNETGARSTSVGRRPIGLVFNPEAGYIAGICIDIERLSLVLCDLDGKVKVEQSATLDNNLETQEISEACIKIIRSACKSIGVSMSNVGVLGLAVPGPLKEDHYFANGARRPEIYNSIKEVLARKMSIPVKIDSLVNMAALAEGMRGAGQGANCLVYFRIGHAMRSAVIINHQLLAGKNNLAGEIGHLTMLGQTGICHCGKTGCVNAIAAVPHFLDRCRKDGIKIDHEQEMPDLAVLGKQNFQVLLTECASAVGFAISAVINTLAPDAVIVSSPYTTCGAAFQEPLTNALSKFTQADLLTQCKILQSQLKGSPEAYGAALSAMQSYPLLEHVSARL